MSFYGSVYYQMIDTFYKVVVKNSGLTSPAFHTASAGDLSTQAIGRKGVFGLDTGNKWLSFSKDIAADGTSVYKIWHNKPDPKGSAQPAYGFELVATESTATPEQQKAATHLNYGDILQTYETKFDEAGHIIGAEPKLYRFPRAEVNALVDTLDGLMGRPTEGKTLYKDIEDPKSTMDKIFPIIEENYDDIKRLEKYVGDWSKIANYGEWEIWLPTIVEVIGDLDNLYGGTMTTSNFRNLVEIIGNIANLDKEMADKEGDTTSLTEAIIKLKELLQSRFNEADRGIQSLMGITNRLDGDIGTRGEAGTIYTEIQGLKKRDTELTQTIEDLTSTHTNDIASLTATHNQDISDLTADIDDLTAAHDKDIDDLTQAYKDGDDAVKQTMTAITDGLGGRLNTLENTTIPSITSRIDTHEKAWVGTEEALKQVDSELNNALEQTNQDVTNLNKKVGTVPENSNVMQELNNARSDLDAQLKSIDESLGEQPGKESAFTLIANNATNIQTNSQAIIDINAIIGEVPTGFDTLVKEIETLQNNLGSPEKEQSAFELIAEIQSDIGTISDGNTVSGLINTNTQSINTLNQSVLTISGDISAHNNRLLAIENIKSENRLQALEGIDAENRITTLEGINAENRITTLEGIDADTRLKALENLNINSELSDINTKLEDLEEADIETSKQISSINETLQSLNAETRLSDLEKNVVTTEQLSETLNQYATFDHVEKHIQEDFVVLKEMYYETDNKVSGIGAALDEINVNLASLGDSTQFITDDDPEGQTVLSKIFDQLNKLNEEIVALKDDVAAIKTAMNDLHSDNAPFPIGPEDVTTE